MDFGGDITDVGEYDDADRMDVDDDNAGCVENGAVYDGSVGAAAVEAVMPRNALHLAFNSSSLL